MPERDGLAAEQQLIWRVIAIVGLTFLVVGLIDAGSAWLPLQLGESEWELGTTSQFFDTFPLLGLGLALMVGAAVARGRTWQVRGLATFCILISVFMWLALALYLTVLPLFLAKITDPIALTPLKKSAAKTGVQALIYPFAFLWLATVAWRASLRKRPTA